MFLKGSYCKAMDSPLLHWDLYNKLLACLNILYIYEFYNTHILKVDFDPIGRQYHMQQLN
jgi:hypothetical protein